MDDYDFRQVSATALVPAFARGECAEIPWAREMVAVLSARGAKLSDAGSDGWAEEAVRRNARFFQARFLAVTNVVEEKGAAQVLELAAGLSPRGMDLAQRGVVYVEADLADSIAMKREIVTAILGSVPEGLHLRAANVIDRVQLLDCCSVFDRKRPVAVTTEGLLRYLTFEEKTELAANVLEILRRFGGWWITTDIHVKSLFTRQSATHREGEKQRLGRSLDANYFDDLEHARRFFEGCGFVVESRRLLDCVPGWGSVSGEMAESYPLFILTAAIG